MKIEKSIYNEYAAGCASVRDGCVAYHGALQYYALQTQQFNTVYMHSSRRFSPFELDGVTYEYHPLKFTYNICKFRDPDGNPITVTSLSQTVVDCIRHIDLAGGLEELLYALSGIGKGMLKEKDMLVCLEAYGNASLWSRVGYLLSLYQSANGVSDKFLSTCRVRGNRVKNKITNGDAPLKYVSDWNLFVPVGMTNILSKGTEYGQEIVF